MFPLSRPLCKKTSWTRLMTAISIRACSSPSWTLRWRQQAARLRVYPWQVVFGRLRSIRRRAAPASSSIRSHPALRRVCDSTGQTRSVKGGGRIIVHATGRKAWGKDLIRCFVPDCFVGTHGIVICHKSLQCLPKFPRWMVFVEVNLFCFQASEPAFNHDVVRPAGFPIHALPNLKFLQQPLIFIAGKLASLVGTIPNSI